MEKENLTEPRPQGGTCPVEKETSRTPEKRPATEGSLAEEEGGEVEEPAWRW